MHTVTPRTLTPRPALSSDLGALTLLASALVFGLAAVPALAQPAQGSGKWSDSARSLIDAAMRANQPNRMNEAVALLERVLSVVPNDGALLHYKGYALYRLATLSLGKAKESEIKAMLDDAEASLIASGKVLAWPETFALQASVYGQMIGLSPGPITAMRLGPKSDNLMDQAVRLGPSNPRVFLMRGIGNIFKPKLFGGGLDKAERDIQKAITLFPADKPQGAAPTWGHAEAFAWLGQVYARDDKRDEARRAYQKALEVDPEFGWVKYVLLPELDKKPR